MRTSQIKDQLAAIGDLVDDAELVTTTLNGFPFSWDLFVQGICARSKLPKFDKLWLDCTQEESKLISKSQKANGDENQALVAHVKKRKERGEFSVKKTKRPCYKKDASKVICYNCKNMGHYVAQCPHRNEKGNTMHMQQTQKSPHPRRRKKSQGMKNLYLFQHS
jgi:hypothetical protein